MTDNEIIKALECCFVETNCSDCPCHIGKPYTEDCLKVAAKNAIDLMKRQKAEIEHYKKAFFNEQKIFSDQVFENECMKVEIERLQKDLDGIMDEIDEFRKDSAQVKFLKKQIKSEAIKEFLEKFKTNLDISVCGYSTEEVKGDIFDTIDTLAKEMTGEKA